MIKLYKHKWRINNTIYLNSQWGFLKLNVYRDGVVELYDFIVYPEYRGKGKGKELFNAAIEVAKSEGGAHLVLWPDTEEWVEKWYKRLGFQEDSRFKNIYGESGWVKEL